MRLEASLIFYVTCLLKIAYGQDRFATDCKTPNNALGLCVEIQNCRKLYEQVVQNNVKAFPFIRASGCGPPNENLKRPKVCCGPDIDYTSDVPDGPEVQLPQRPEEQPITTTTVIPPPSGHSVLPRMCGKQKILIENRIFGGQAADIGEFPWLARLVHYNIYNRAGLGCSGFVIHRRFILTAAHCLQAKGIEHLGPLRNVILGVHNDTKARVCIDEICTDPPVNIDTLEPVIHPDYNSSTHIHDIALIPLNQRVNFTDFIKAICLPRSTTNSSRFTISGWGRTESDTSSRMKLKVEIPRADHANCISRYKTLGLQISEAQLCAGGERGEDSCSGDSGGPLMAIGDQDRWYAEGIVSFGNSCGRQGWPGVYTYIPKYYDWIVNEIKKFLKANNITG